MSWHCVFKMIFSAAMVMKDPEKWRGTVEMIRRTATATGRAESGFFCIEGIRLHERAVRAGVTVERAITNREFVDNPASRNQALIKELDRVGCQVSIVPDEIVNEIIAGRGSGPILGLVKLPSQPKLSDILSSVDQPQRLILAAVDVKDPGNVGALIRTAHAAGATAFAAVGISDPFHPRALRITRGSLFKIPVLRYDQVSALLADMKDLKIETVGTAVKGGTLLTETSFSDKGTAVLMGSEAWGLPENIQSAVDKLVTIPMNAEVDSYSVNAAAAIVLYEISRLRI